MSNAPPLQPDAGDTPPRHNARLWMPLAIIAFAVLVSGATLWADSTEWLSPANAFLTRSSCIGLSAILLFVWFLIYAPLSRVARLQTGIVGLGLLLAAAALFRVEGVSGDIVPSLRFRFAPRADETLPKITGKAPSEVRVDLTNTTSRDYPEFLGPGRLATLDQAGLSHDWTAHPPKKLWRQPIGAAWSQFAVVGDFAVTQEQRADEELITCYEVATGKLAWAHATPVRYFETIAGVGPRATPTIHNGKVYALGAMGHLTCLDGATGKQLWQHDVVKDTSAIPPTWGKSCSPLILDDLVIVSAGGPSGKSLVAYDKNSGILAWSGGDQPSSYCSPMVASLCGRRQVLMVNVTSIDAHDPADGRVLWEHPWPGYDPGSPTCSQPIAVGDDRLLLSKGYGGGSLLLKIERSGDDWTIKEQWKTLNLRTKFTNAVIRDGFAYALDEGTLECVDIDSGAKKWKQGKYGHGQILLVGDLILVQSEAGDIALVEAKPQSYRELARFAAIKGTCWNPPALSGNRLLVRSEEEAACYELPLAEK